MSENAEETVEKVEQPAEQAEQAPEPVERQNQDNPLLKTLFEIETGEESVEEEQPEEPQALPQTLNEAVEALDQPEEQEQPEEAKEEVKEEAKEEEPAKSEPKKKKLRKVIDPDLPDDIKAEYNFEPEEKEEEDDFEKTLLPEELEVYSLAKYAAKNMGDTYKGYDVKFKEFFEKSKSFLDKRIEEDPHYNPSDDDDYATFIDRNRPKFTQSDAKKIEKKMWIEEAKNDVRKELEPETAELRKKLERAQREPIIQQAKAKFRNMAQGLVIPEEYRETFEKGGQEAINKFAEENPLEFEILDKATQSLLTYGDTLTDILLKNVELDPNNNVHKDLIDWVNREQENFINSGQTERDGKVFMRRERFLSLPDNHPNKAQYYTWEDDDLLKILALRSQEQVSGALKAQRERLEKAGYVKATQAKQPEQPVQKVVQQQPAKKPPAINPTPRPGNNLATPSDSTTKNAMLEVLGL